MAGLSRSFLVSLDDVDQGKPSPEGVLQAINWANAQQVWMCGDNVDDMRAAKAAGALAIGIGQHRHEVLLASGADIVLKDINHLQALLC